MEGRRRLYKTQICRDLGGVLGFNQMRLAIYEFTKLTIHEQVLAEAGDKGKKNLGFYTGRSNKNTGMSNKHHPWGLSYKSIQAGITFNS